MSEIKDIDLKAQARKRAEELRVAKLIANHDFSNIIPPELAPREYALTAADPSTYPLSLTELSGKFGGSGNLLSLLGKTVGVPKSPPLAISDYDGKGLTYRVNGRINIDRFDSLEGAGLFSKPSYTWDRNDNTGFPESTTLTGNPWRYSLSNSFSFLEWMIATFKVSNIRTLKVGFRQTDNTIYRDNEWTGLYMTSAGAFEDLTFTIKPVEGDVSGPVRTSEIDLVINNVPTNNIKYYLSPQAIENCKSFIENAFLSRITMESLFDDTGVQYTDYYIIGDFDVVAI